MTVFLKNNTSQTILYQAVVGDTEVIKISPGRKERVDYLFRGFTITKEDGQKLNYEFTTEHYDESEEYIRYGSFELDMIAEFILEVDWNVYIDNKMLNKENQPKGFPLMPK